VAVPTSGTGRAGAGTAAAIAPGGAARNGPAVTTLLSALISSCEDSPKPRVAAFPRSARCAWPEPGTAGGPSTCLVKIPPTGWRPDHCQPRIPPWFRVSRRMAVMHGLPGFTTTFRSFICFTIVKSQIYYHTAINVTRRPPAQGRRNPQTATLTCSPAQAPERSATGPPPPASRIPDARTDKPLPSRSVMPAT
jgi:hypothetical protein